MTTQTCCCAQMQPAAATGRRASRSPPGELIPAYTAARTQKAASHLSQEQLADHLESIQLTQSGIAYVIQAMLDRPARKVRSSRQGNLIGEFSSGVQAGFQTGPVEWRIQFESMSGEFAYAMQTSLDPDVMVLLDQPNLVPLVTQDKNGRARRITYTPDYLVVRPDEVQAIQVKPTPALNQLCSERPWDWIRNESEYSYVPADKQFRSYGISHIVIPTETISWLRIQNLMLLRDFTGLKLSSECRTLHKKLMAAVSTLGPTSMADLKRGFGLTTTAPILCAIAKGAVHADLDRISLYDPNSPVICATTAQAKIVGEATENDFQITTTDQTAASTVVCHPKYSEELIYRLATIQGEPTDWSERAPPSQRTIMRWKAAFKNGGERALIPRWADCGMRGRRSSDTVIQPALQQIAGDKGSSNYPSRVQSYADYCDNLTKQTDDRPISYSHYCELWKSRKHSIEDALGKGGQRLANAVAPHQDVDSQDPLSMGPFSVGRVDHCQAPILLIDESGADATAWVTLLTDDYTGEPLAYVIRTRAPSFEACGLVIRECIRRHGRLPRTIASDGGADFRGVQFRACLAQFGVNWARSPAADPRGNHAVERPFGTFANLVCRGRPGFVPDITNLRAISRSKHPRQLAKSRMQDFIVDTEKFFYELLPNKPRAGQVSPRKKRDAFEKTYGKQGLIVSLALPELIATSAPIEAKGRSGSAGDIRLKSTRYYSTKLHAKCISLRRLAPRIDCEDRTKLYFHLDGAWHVAKSRANLHTRGRATGSVSKAESSLSPISSVDLHAWWNQLRQVPPADQIDTVATCAKQHEGPFNSSRAPKRLSTSALPSLPAIVTKNRTWEAE